MSLVYPAQLHRRCWSCKNRKRVKSHFIPLFLVARESKTLRKHLNWEEGDSNAQLKPDPELVPGFADDHCIWQSESWARLTPEPPHRQPWEQGAFRPGKYLRWNKTEERSKRVRKNYWRGWPYLLQSIFQNHVWLSSHLLNNGWQHWRLKTVSKYNSTLHTIRTDSPHFFESELLSSFAAFFYST